MKRVLVTGAGGYIGGILVPKLLGEGYFVTAVDRFFFGADKLEPHENLSILQDDTRRLTAEHFQNIDYVVDLVAISNDPSGEMFEQSTWQINHLGRAEAARLAKEAGVERYILPSSCSIYGYQESIADETSKTNPLTVYAKANEKAETDTLKLADEHFCVSVMRQATVFGYGPRMRFDLAINGMTYGAYTNRKLPLMRDGSQYRPMLHVQDTTDLMCMLIKADMDKINGEIFNVGSEENTYQLGDLGTRIANTVSELIGEKIDIEWYGEPDHRSYQVAFDKVQKVLNWKPKWSAEMGCREIVEKLQSGEITKTPDTITLDWYRELAKWHKIIRNVEMYDGILDI